MNLIFYDLWFIKPLKNIHRSYYIALTDTCIAVGTKIYTTTDPLGYLYRLISNH